MKLRMKISSLVIKMIKILSQKVCPKCDQLFQYLKYGLQDKYVDQIEVIKKEENTVEFNEYVQKFQIMSTPAIIINDKVLKDCTPLNVAKFLSENVK